VKHAIILEQKRGSRPHHNTRGLERQYERAENDSMHPWLRASAVSMEELAADTRVKPSSSRQRMGHGAESAGVPGSEKLAGQAVTENRFRERGRQDPAARLP